MDFMLVIEQILELFNQLNTSSNVIKLLGVAASGTVYSGMYKYSEG